MLHFHDSAPSLPCLTTPLSLATHTQQRGLAPPKEVAWSRAETALLARAAKTFAGDPCTIAALVGGGHTCQEVHERRQAVLAAAGHDEILVQSRSPSPASPSVEARAAADADESSSGASEGSSGEDSGDDGGAARKARRGKRAHRTPMDASGAFRFVLLRFLPVCARWFRTHPIARH